MTTLVTTVAVSVWLSLAIYITLTGWFFAYTKIKELHEKGVQFDWVVRVPMYAFLFIGFVCDVILNAVWGSIIFRELPRELTFSQRLRRWKWSGHPAALRWRDRINKIQPDHI
jgi:type IV secretory pathway TrbL component